MRIDALGAGLERALDRIEGRAAASTAGAVALGVVLGLLTVGGGVLGFLLVLAVLVALGG